MATYIRSESAVRNITYRVPGPANWKDVQEALDTARSENRRQNGGNPACDKAVIVSVKNSDILVSFTVNHSLVRSVAFDGSSNPLDFDDGEVVEDSDRQYWMRVYRDDDSGWSTFGDNHVYPLNAPRFPVTLVT